MKIVCIIQARMGSTRLPGKIMKEIAGRPILWHVIERVKRSKKISSIVIATTTNHEDDQVERFCKDNRLFLFRGSMDDVLDRYYNAARQNNADVIVRVTSDCPLVDPDVLDELVNLFLGGNYDYVSNNKPPSYPHGLDAEVFSFAALEKAWKEAKLSAEREHVTPYMRKNPGLFRIGNLRNKADLSKMRWTVDFEEDYLLVKKIYSLLGKKAISHDFNFSEILRILNVHPELQKMNENVKWKETRK
ncbi:MAG: glycosyltransferase family protein [Candidatus Micrarchaeota archaeon]